MTHRPTLLPLNEDDSLEVFFPDRTADHRRKSSMASPSFRTSALDRSITPSCVHSLLSNPTLWVRDNTGNPDTGSSTTPMGSLSVLSSPTVGLIDSLTAFNNMMSLHSTALSTPPHFAIPSSSSPSPASASSAMSSPLDQSDSPVQSRQLTKKQLSGMAFTVRELAKTLSRIKLKPKMNNIFLLMKAHDTSILPRARELMEWILAQESLAACNIHIEHMYEHDEIFDLASIVAQDEQYQSRIRFWTNETCAQTPQLFDLVLALGGDGTVLYASSLFQGVVPPVISFCLGSLGFLTKFDFGSFRPTLTHILSGGMGIRLRLRLEATIMRSKGRDRKDRVVSYPDIVEQLLAAEPDNEQEHTHTSTASFNVLNEVVVDRGPNPTMATLELFGDGYHYTTIQADGLCVATPTGSTAYNLAAGGSLCHPDNPVVLVTAICAHTLSFRPIILPDTIVLRIAVPYDSRTTSWVSFDGRDRTELLPGDYVTISASRFPFPSVLPPGTTHEDWIDSISRTLNWNSRTRQKPWQDKSERVSE